MKEISGTWWAINLDEEMKNLRSKVEHLSALESDILIAVENGEIQPGHKRKREVELWFGNVKQKKTELEGIETEFKDHGPSRKLKSDVEKKTKEVAELIQQGKFSSGILLVDHSTNRLAMVTSTLVGQKCAENIALILKSLQDDDVLAIGLHGMGGVGKTALLKQIHNYLLQDCNIAGQVHWVTVSQDCSLLKLQNSIGKTLGLDLSLQEDVERRRSLLFHRFSQLGRSVLILDDLWTYYLIDQVGIPLNTRACKIVLTTRSLDVCRRMNCQQVIKVVPLLQEEACKLFVENLGDVPPNVYPILEVVEECGGLPLALITMGQSMRGINDAHLWENTLYELRKPLSGQVDMGHDVFRLLKFSYDSLKDEKLKHCFLSCVLFPEDVKILRDNLIDLWIMEGLLDERERRQDQINYGHAILNRLENASLLEAGISFNQRCVSMHDLIRDLALIIVTQHYPRFLVKSGSQLKKVPEEQHWTKDLVKASLSWNHIQEIPSGMSPETPLLKVLLLNDNPIERIPDSFFVHMKELRILDLSDTKIIRLPESLSDLENMRSLLLGGCLELRYVPSVANLAKLRVLDLPNNRKIKQEPKDIVYCDQLRHAHSGKHPKLRMLDLRFSGKLEDAPRGLEKLKCIEKLCSCPWKMADVMRFNVLVQSWQLHEPEQYQFWLYDEACWQLVFKENYHPDKCLRRVFILGGTFGAEDLSPLLPHTTELLDIRYMESQVKRGLADVLSSLAGLNELKVLKLSNCVGIENIETSATLEENSFMHLQLETLERLEVSGLPDLKMITNSRSYCYSKLKVLKIARCPKIKVCLLLKSSQYHLQGFLPNLERFEVRHCKDLEQIFGLGDKDEINSANPGNVLAFPSLTRVILWDLPNLSCIYSDQLQCSCLWELEILDCPNLKIVPPLNCI